MFFVPSILEALSGFSQFHSDTSLYRKLQWGDGPDWFPHIQKNAVTLWNELVFSGQYDL